MIIAGRFSFNGGEEAVQQKYPHLLAEIEEAITLVDSEQHRNKESQEKTMMGEMLYSPVSLNKVIKAFLTNKGWISHRVTSNRQII